MTDTKTKPDPTLCERIDTLCKDANDYNLIVDALAGAAVLGFERACSVLPDATQQQRDLSDLRYVRLRRGLAGPLMVITGEDLLFNRNINATVNAAQREWLPWAALQAQAHLKDQDKKTVAPALWTHWEALAATLEKPEKKDAPSKSVKKRRALQNRSRT